MILDIGEKVHIIEKRRFPEDVRRHFIGEITRCTESNLRVKGYVWVYDSMQQTYIRYPEKRERVISLEGDLIINILPQNIVIGEVRYAKDPEKGMIVMEGMHSILTINEFGARQ